MTIFKCETCSKEFVRIAHLEKHRARKKPCSAVQGADDHDQFFCEKCQKYLRHESSLSRHRKLCKGPKLTSEQKIQELTTKLGTAQNELVAAQSELATVKAEAEQDVGTSKNEPVIVSCNIGSIGDIFKPGVYFGSPGPLLIPEVDVVGQLIKFGESHDVPQRISKSHVPDFGGFTTLDCIATIDCVLIEKRFKSLLDMSGKLVKCKTANKVYRDTEVFVVRDQQEYQELVMKCKALADEHAMEVIGLNKEIFQARCDQKEAEVRSLKLELELTRNSNETMV